MAGASATATAAAWAKRFEAPMTKVSKRYFGFSRAVGSPGPVAGAGWPPAARAPRWRARGRRGRRGGRVRIPAGARAGRGADRAGRSRPAAGRSRRGACRSHPGAARTHRGPVRSRRAGRRTTGAPGLRPVVLLVRGAVLVGVRGRRLLAVRLLVRGRVGVPFREAEALLLPAVVVLLRGAGPGAGLGALVLLRIGGPGGGELVGAVAAVSLVLVAVAVLLAAALAGGGELGLLVAVLGAGGRRLGRLRSGAGGFARGVVDGDRDADRAPALAAQGLADDRREAALQYALRKFVRYGEQGGVGDQRERLAAPDPVLVLRLDALPAALSEKLLQYAWPHCGKIGRYVSHRARSLTSPSKV